MRCGACRTISTMIVLSLTSDTTVPMRLLRLTAVSTAASVIPLSLVPRGASGRGRGRVRHREDFALAQQRLEPRDAAAGLAHLHHVGELSRRRLEAQVE